jgi:hypothetical protein
MLPSHPSHSSQQFLKQRKIKIKINDLRFNKGASSMRAVSEVSSNHDLIKIPLSGYLLKFSATLSTMMVFCKGLPNLLKSLM